MKQFFNTGDDSSGESSSSSEESNSDAGSQEGVQIEMKKPWAGKKGFTKKCLIWKDRVARHPSRAGWMAVTGFLVCTGGGCGAGCCG